MLTSPGKLRQAIESAGEQIRAAADGTGRLVLVALALAGAALLMAAAALVMMLRGGIRHAS